MDTTTTTTTNGGNQENNDGNHSHDGGEDDDDDSTMKKSTYTNVILYKKKIQGTLLVLSERGLQFVVATTTTTADKDDETTDNVYWSLQNWNLLVKHQVSPISHSKALLKLLIIGNSSSTDDKKKTTTTTVVFQMSNRNDLNRIRKDITEQLLKYNNNNKNTNNKNMPTTTTTNGNTSKKRDYWATSASATTAGTTTAAAATSFGYNYNDDLDSTAMAVVRSSLLAAHPSLREQHKQLVLDSKLISECDFWNTHAHLVQDEYAKISGLAKSGLPSVLQSHLPNSGRVSLGVQEMRQIFILYPAVHKAYEEKVPLELSEEQFWRKYLESEYFHRDRGRMGTAARQHGNGNNASANKNDNKHAVSIEQQDARAAAVGTDDLFSRYDQKLAKQQEQQQRQQQLQQQQSSLNDASNMKKKASDKHLAIGQFDLASTYETERGRLLEGPRDLHPANNNASGIGDGNDDKGARVIQKYNRHWAMVLHPDEAVAGCNLMDVARKSAQDEMKMKMRNAATDNISKTKTTTNLDDHRDMRRLVAFANDPHANHATGRGWNTTTNRKSHHTEEDDDEEDDDDVPYEPLTLKNIEAYYSVNDKSSNIARKDVISNPEEAAKKHSVFAKAMAAKTHSLVHNLKNDSSGVLPESCFPPPALGRQLLSALTKKMAKDSQTEAQSLEIVHKLPTEFRQKLQSYFRRSSELLRHFFGLRKLSSASPGQQKNNTNPKKLARIVSGMETFYREMEGMRRELPQTEQGEMMRKMCLPIMDQLDWAFKLHREGSGGGGGGGFVAVDEDA